MTAETGLTCEVWVTFFWDGRDHQVQFHRDRADATLMVKASGSLHAGPYRVLIPVPAALIPPTVRATVEEAT